MGVIRGIRSQTKRAAFVAPTRDDIIAYVEEEGLRNVDPRRIYESLRGYRLADGQNPDKRLAGGGARLECPSKRIYAQ